MIFKEITYPIVCENQTCTLNLYVNIKDEYRLFAAKGAVFTPEHCRLYKKPDFKVYITAQDYENAKEHIDNRLFELLTDPMIEPEAKADIVYTSSMKSVRDVFQGTSMRTIGKLEKLSKNIVKFILANIRVMDDLIKISSHDHYTYKHSVKVGILGTSLSANLFQERINEHNMAELSTAFFLHDIGMAKVPARILDKKTMLDASEWDIIRKHPLWGHDKLVKANYLSSEAASVVLYHHERWDGRGYPFKKSRKDIPLYAKICAIADTFEALTSERSFRPAKSPFQALKIMQAEMANEFEPELFKAFIMLLGPGK